MTPDLTASLARSRAPMPEANGYAERDTALRLLHRRRSQRQTQKRWTVAGDKGYDTKDFVAGCRALGGDTACHAAHQRPAQRHR
jgi:hypothetical protein